MHIETMHTRNFIGVVLSFLSILSCVNKQDSIGIDDDMRNIYVNCKLINKHNDEPLRMSSVYDSVQYVLLDDVEQSVLIGEITEVRATDKYLYIYDRFSSTIYQYNYSGELIQKYHHVGRGRGEYITITTFDVDTRNGNVSVYDVSSSKMLVYSSNDEFLYSFKIEEDVPRDFALLDNGDYLFLTYDYMKGARRGIWQCDSLGAFKKQLVEIDANFKYASGIIPSYFRHIGNKVYVKGPEDNSYLYHISSDTIVASYKVHTGIKIPKRIRRNPLPTTNEENKGKVYSIVNYCETDSWVLLSVYDMIDNPTMLYNKRTNASYYILSNDDEVIDDMPFVGTVITTTSEAFINIISVDMILSHQLLMEQFPTIDSNSNPVIAICRLTK